METIETHSVRFDLVEDAQRFVRAIRRRGYNARRRRNTVFVVIGSRASLDLLVKQWAVTAKHSPYYDAYTFEE